MSIAKWTRPVQLIEILRQRWERGDILRAAIGASVFPLEIRLKRPTGDELSHHFAEAREWVRELELGSRAQRGAGYELLCEQIHHRQLGTNSLPKSIRIERLDDALFLLGMGDETQRFSQAVARTVAVFPELRDWIEEDPFALLEEIDAWPQVLRVLLWFRANLRSGKYLRQLDIPGIDTKFIEARRGLFVAILDRILPIEAIDGSSVGAHGFEQRYGLRSKPVLIRFRLLDERLYIGGFSDLSVPLDEFARIGLDCDTVFITENDMNGLAFPKVARSMVIFGLGYGLRSLTVVPWLALKSLRYWGDIDTHGFAMLDGLRRHFPQVRSLLMDRSTLEGHRELWTHELRPSRATLAHLSVDESLLYHQLQNNVFGVGVRLEQERIGFASLIPAIAQSFL